MADDRPKQPAVADATDAITPVQESTERVHAVNSRADKAAQFIAEHGEVTFTYEEERRVLRRIDLRILPLILGAYFFQQLDKSSLSYVSIFGIMEDANLKSTEYSLLGSILYIAQLIFQPLAAFLLVKLPTGKVIGTAVICWVSDRPSHRLVSTPKDGLKSSRTWNQARS